MSAAAIVTLVIVGVIVVALAAFLLWVVAMLRRITSTLGKVTFGVRAIAHRVEPVGPLVTQMNGDLSAVADALEQLAAKVGAGRAPSVTAM
jgi:hypothetical protein